MKYVPNDRSSWESSREEALAFRIIGIIVILLIALFFASRYYDNQENKSSIFNPIIEHSEIPPHILK